MSWLKPPPLIKKPHRPRPFANLSSLQRGRVRQLLGLAGLLSGVVGLVLGALIAWQVSRIAPLNQIPFFWIVIFFGLLGGLLGAALMTRTILAAIDLGDFESGS